MSFGSLGGRATTGTIPTTSGNPVRADAPNYHRIRQRWLAPNGEEEADYYYITVFRVSNTLAIRRPLRDNLV